MTIKTFDNTFTGRGRIGRGDLPCPVYRDEKNGGVSRFRRVARVRSAPRIENLKAPLPGIIAGATFAPDVELLVRDQVGVAVRLTGSGHEVEVEVVE